MRLRVLIYGLVSLFASGCLPYDPALQSTASQDVLPPAPAKRGTTGAKAGAHEVTADSVVGVTIARVCSMERSKTREPFYEETMHPILAFALLAPPAPADEMPSEGGTFTRIENDPDYLPDPLEYEYVGTVLSVDLKDVDLIKGRYFGEVKLGAALIEFEKKSGRSLEGMVVAAQVCDDPQGLGVCHGNVESIVSLDFYTDDLDAEALPQSVDVNVFSGRGLNKSAHPRLCEQQHSPIVLDVGGKGIRLSPPERGAEFDLMDTGEPIATGWIASRTNALLARDLDGNGRIDSGAELFGSATRLSDGRRAANGFEALAELDSDSDGRITPRDDQWRALRLWFDRNFDARTQPGELVMLDPVGIRWLALAYTRLDDSVDAHGNQFREHATFGRLIDGIEMPLSAVDVWFRTLVSE